MWKYQCKKHLGILGVTFVIGAILFGAMGYQRELLELYVRQYNMQDVVAQVPYIYYLAGGLTVSAIANGLLILTYLIQKFNVPFFAVILVMFVAFEVIAVAGMLLLLPAIIICIIGWMTIPNRGKHKELSKDSVTTVAEVERVYRLHHSYLNEYEEMGKKAWSFMMKMNTVYALGLVGIVLVILYVQEFTIVLIAMMMYSILFFQLTKRKNQALQPIVSLLYNECKPEACASAIFAFAKKSRKKKTFPLPQHLAQCMIYLNDPHLAIDVLATCNQSKGNFIFAYHSLMAYAYYQLGDESMVKYHYEQCDSATSRVNNGPMLVIKQQCLEGIQNKLDLMNQDFNRARTFYQKSLPNVGFEFQRVDFRYFLGLIAFVDRDLEEAKSQFDYVVKHGGTIFYVEKAQSFLKSIDAALDAQQEE